MKPQNVKSKRNDASLFIHLLINSFVDRAVQKTFQVSEFLCLGPLNI